MRILTALFCCLVLCSQLLHAEEKQFEFQHKIESGHPAEVRHFSVQLPKSYYSQADFDYPVLYVLDGESNMEFSSAVAGYLADNGLVPEMIVVGIHAGPNRTRDYVPTAGNASGTGQFLEYIANELVPFIEKKYRSAPLRIISGHSYGGLFVFYSMVKSPDLFAGYLVQSPFVDQANGANVLKHVAATWDEATGNRDVFVFANVGNEPNLEANFARLETLMESKSSRSVRLVSKREQNKTHMTTRLTGLYDGLEEFFREDWPLTSRQIVTGKAKGLVAHVENLGRKYGYAVLYSEPTLVQAIQIFLSQQDFDSSLVTARLYAKQRPQSALAHFFVASSLAAKGNREGASVAISKAIELFEKNPRTEWQPLYPQMKAMQQQL